MPRPENLRLRLKLLSDLDQLAARLEASTTSPQSRRRAVVSQD